MKKETKDKLADIVWYIKGQLHQEKLSDNYTGTPFDEGHILALEEAMNQNLRIEDVSLREGEIFIEKANGGFNVSIIDNFGDRLNWDEMIGLVSSITMPEHRPCVRYLQPKKEK